MSRWLFALSLLLGLAGVQQGDEAYPGQSHHAEPPAGWECHRAPADLSGDPSKWCGCEKYCDPDTPGKIKADKWCGSWCWEEQHCKCPMGGDQPTRCMPAEPPR